MKTRRMFTHIAAALSASLLASPGAMAADSGSVEAGQLVSNASGCSACHTGPSGKPFAGGTVLSTPFGDMATANITPDKETGIGTWTRDDFEGALRRGVKKDGLPLYPSMPYVHFTKMTDDDIDALWAYMQTVEPVNNRVDVNQLPFPFDVRASVFGWQMLFFTEGRFQPDTTKSEVWNRGAYLVEALSHCGACHTPRDAVGGPITSRSLQGSRVAEWYAPDISDGPDSVIADWDVARLEGFLNGNDGMNHVAVGPMAEVLGELATIPPSDVHAIATYMKDQPPSDDKRSAPEEVKITPALRQEWAGLFEGECVTCHGADGEGAPGVAASLVGSGAVLARSPVNVISVLLEGIAPMGDYGAMPSFRDSLSNEQIAALANHVRTSWGNDAPANARPDMVAGLRNVTSSTPGATMADTCPNVPADRISAALRGQIETMAAASTLDDAAVGDLIAKYDASNPDATTTNRVVDLGGAYCQALEKNGAGKATIVSRQLALMNAVVTQSVAN
ncbi:cytochrome c [Acuticoccus sp. MNP-M23]|uniref:cytochrome c n=1 Tax=Acuticoccus sp. MNP-M23 TaxID=3072793 RepID=UPI002815F5B9|nr:cytochrome c [Acuticoccus sp. MNP-M23]WMS42644.1 cytochrome c [Acuticoccus sp. MNP-M23]